MVTFSIIQKSQLEGAKRLDAEYYQPEYLVAQKTLFQAGTISLKDVAVIATGPAYSSEQIGEGFKIPLARIGDVVNKIDFDSWLRVSEKEFEKFHNQRVKNLDILLSMTGDPPDVGKCSLIAVAENQTLAFNQRVAKLTSRVNPYYLFAYLSTSIARLQVERNALGIRQRNLGVNDLLGMLVFLPDSQEELEAIAALIRDYLSEMQRSKSLYSQAESLLLEGLGLTDFEKDERLSWTVNLSDVKTANRMDAEHFQPKYEKLISKLKNYNVRPLGDLVTMKKGIETGSEVYQEEGELFIRVSSLSQNGIEDRDQKYLSEELYQKLWKDFEPKVGDILLTKDATPGIAYHVQEPITGIVSGGILRLKLKEEIEPEYLVLCINSVIGQMQVECDAGGSVIAHWRPEQIKGLRVPILPMAIQQKIAELVRQSHEARKKSKKLLEEAKRKVEEAIECEADNR